MSFLFKFTINRTASTVATFRVLQKCTLSQKLSTVFSTRFLLNTKPLNLLKSQKFCSRGIDVNTNVAKDVILFKYENPKFFKVLNIFGISQLIFWGYLAHFSFTTLRDAPVDESRKEELAWYESFNLGENKYRNTITGFCLLLGYGILAAAWLFTLRSVRFLILRKGGNEVSFVTYTPFGENRIMTVPLKYVSAQESRDIAKTQLPIKVKNRSLFYILDMRGEFRNPTLFDHTAGLRRRLN